MDFRVDIKQRVVIGIALVLAICSFFIPVQSSETAKPGDTEGAAATQAYATVAQR